MDPLEQATSEQNSLEKLVAWVPGYKGYKAKEVRREVDKQLRESLVAKLSTRQRKLTSLQSDLLSAGGLLWMDDMEKLVAKLQLFSDRVRTASYGYAPFFGAKKVKEDDLDRMYEFDTQLVADLGRLDEAITGLEGAIQTNENIKEWVQTTSTVLMSFNETFGRREEVITGIAQQ